MKFNIKFLLEETILFLLFLGFVIMLVYSPIWGIDQPEDKVEYKYLLCEIKATKQGFEFFPVDGQKLSYKDCRKKEKRSETKICIADINDTVIIEEELR